MFLGTVLINRLLIGFQTYHNECKQVKMGNDWVKIWYWVTSIPKLLEKYVFTRIPLREYNL